MTDTAWRFQVQNTTTGEWEDLGAVEELHLEPSADAFDDEPVTTPTRMSWSTDFTFQDPEAGRELFAHLERIATAQRWAARRWLKFPYRPRGAHRGR